MNPRTESFPAIGSDGEEYEIFCIRKEIPQSGGQQDLPEYRLDSPTGEHLNKKKGEPFKTIDERLTLTAKE